MSAIQANQTPAVLRSAIPLDVRNATRTTDLSEQNRQGLGVGEDGDPSPTLTGLFTPAVFAYDDRNQASSTGTHHTLRADGIGSRVSDAVLATTQYGNVAGTLSARADGSPCADRGPNMLAVGIPFRMTVIGEYTTGELSSALKACDHKEPKDLVVPSVGIPRRLMPVECERLMGWPDDHTRYGVDENGCQYALSDTARYKLCGNGVASPVAGWIAWRLREALDTFGAGH